MWLGMISKKAALWLVPVVVTIHNLEEALFMPSFLEARNSAVPGWMRDLLPPITYRQFLIALVIVTAVPYLSAWFGNLGNERSAGLYFLLGFQVVMLINVLAHGIIAVLMRGYAPGVITAFLINLPFSVYLLRRAVNE